MRRYMIEQRDNGNWVIMKYVGPRQWALNSHTEYDTEEEAAKARDDLKRGAKV